MKKVIKSNIKIILGFILGLIWSSGIVYAAVNGYLFDSDEVYYDNTTSNLQATDVQNALDELYVESTSYQLFEQRVSALETYNTNWTTLRALSTMTVNTSQALPSGWNELLVYVSHNATSDNYYSFHIYKNFFKDAFIDGYGAGGTTCYVNIKINSDASSLTLVDARNSNAVYNPFVVIFYR